MSPTISFFATIAYFVCYKLSGEVSGESPVCVRRAQPFLFYFVGEPFFATLKQNRDFFATRQQKGHVLAREAGG
jgi:hypothetical protein